MKTPPPKPPEEPPANLVSILIQACNALLEQGQWASAHETAGHAVTLARSSQDPEGLRTALFGLAKSLSKLERRDEAREHWSECLSLQEQHGDLIGAAHTACELGVDHRLAGETEESRSFLRKSLSLSADTPPGPIKGRALEQLGIVERSSGSLDEAARLFESALRVYEALDDPTRIAGAREKLGNTYQDLGQLDRAMEHYRTCLGIYEQTRDLPRLAALHNNLAGTLHRRGELQSASQHFEEARELFQELGLKKKLAVTLGNLGVLKTWMGQSREAESLLLEGLGFLQELGEKSAQPSAMHNLSLVCFFGGRYEETIGWTDQSIEAREKLGHRQRTPKTWINRAYALLELGRLSEARDSRNRAAKAAEPGSHPETEAELGILDTAIAIRRCNFPEAIRLGTTALEVARAASLPRLEAEACLLLGEASLQAGDADSARNWLMECESRYERLRLPYHAARCSLHLGRLFHTGGSYEAAARKLREAADGFARLENASLEMPALLELARSEWHLSPTQAERTLDHATERARAMPGRNFEPRIQSLLEELRRSDTIIPETAAQLAGLLRDSSAVLFSKDRMRYGGAKPLARILEYLQTRLALSGLQFVPESPESDEVTIGNAHFLGEGGSFDEDKTLRTELVSHGFAFRELEDGCLVGAASASRIDDRDATFLLARATEPRARAERLFPALLTVVEFLGTYVHSLQADARGNVQKQSPAQEAHVASGSPVDIELPQEFSPGSDRGNGENSNSPPSVDENPTDEHGHSETQFHGMVGSSAALGSVQNLIRKIAPSDASVLIQGESGTGKELVARAIHALSDRRGSLVAINCPSFPRELIEAELFGYEKGAFTGATGRKEGQVERAHDGTLFLDEIGDLEMAAQTKLLRFLEQREFLRIGGREPIHINVRLVAATSRDLAAELAAGRFREDLYHRIRVVPIQVPPLRQRPEDIETLARHFLQAFSPAKRFSKEAIELLRTQPFKGNVRELRNLVERLSATHNGNVIRVSDIPEEFRESFVPTSDRRLSPPDAMSSSKDAKPSDGLGFGEEDLHAAETLPARLMSVEGALIRRELERCEWNQSQAARRLGITESTIRDRMRRYHIERPEQTRKAGRRSRNHSNGDSP